MVDSWLEEIQHRRVVGAVNVGNLQRASRRIQVGASKLRNFFGDFAVVVDKDGPEIQRFVGRLAGGFPVQRVDAQCFFRHQQGRGYLWSFGIEGNNDACICGMLRHF